MYLDTFTVDVFLVASRKRYEFSRFLQFNTQNAFFWQSQVDMIVGNEI